MPAIAPVFEGVHRPCWSVMIPTYNCAQYLGEALRSVLSQDPGPQAMQIEVIDDCSTRDDPESVVREVGGGRVSFYRQPKNVGAIANFNTCIQRSTGHLVHILHGDDTILPDFYARMGAGLDGHPEVGAAVCRHLYMNENSNWRSVDGWQQEKAGVMRDWLESAFVGNWIVFHGIIIRRSVYEQIGGYHLELFHAADWDMWRRLASQHAIWYTPEVLACYRQHSASDTARLVVSGANIANVRLSIEIARQYAGGRLSRNVVRRALRGQARLALLTARRMILRGGQIGGALANVREALRCSVALGILVSVLGLACWAGWVWARRAASRVWRLIGRALGSRP